MILRSFYNGAFSIASKHDFDDLFFFVRDSNKTQQTQNVEARRQ
jgi:hypothetical protein